ncbi:MAG: hypothetical protein K2X35_03305 [Bryobacteraceae bacterium]|nr:hypothetical protein [Bryobacteraceae bacterium]
MFLFEQMFNQAVAGIAPMMSVVMLVAYGILLASLLFSVYEAWARGGDVRALGIAGVKYLAVGLLFINDGVVYRSVFQSVVGAFNQMAQAMAGPGDVFRTWFNELRNAASWDTWLNVVTGTLSGAISALLLMVAMVVYPVAYGIFTILYCLFGTILYATGPLVLAVMPSFGLGSLAKRYATNVVIFASWGLLYGVFCRLTLAINLNSMAAITAAGNLMGMMVAASAEVLLAVVSILFSVCILLIPFLAKRIVEGDVGSSMLTVLGTTTAMAQAMMSMAAGPGDGWSRMGAGGGGGGGEKGAANPVGGPAPSGPGSGGSSGSVGSAGGSGAPSGPGGRAMGAYRPPNVPHAVGWLAGAAAALAVQGGVRAAQAGKELVKKAGGSPSPSTPPRSTPPPSNGNPVDEWV